MNSLLITHARMQKIIKIMNLILPTLTNSVLIAELPGALCARAAEHHG